MIRFNKPYIVGTELHNVEMVLKSGRMSGDGDFTHKCQNWLKEKTGTAKALLTHSCTAALEMAIILAGIEPGDEVIMPSFTFVSTANSVVLRGGVPVFVDIRSDTLNINENKIENAITSRTRAIMVVHYAGVACEMDSIMKIAEKHNLIVIEDAAQAVLSEYRGKALGSIGHFGAISFHETKNLVSGEGGALLINSFEFVERAEIIWEKGTNRKKYFQGLVDKYTWVDIGSSFLPSELTAAVLYGQLESSEIINESRMKIWKDYHEAFEELEEIGRLRRPIVPDYAKHNAHIYYLLTQSVEERDVLLSAFRKAQIGAVFHYIPLHSSPAGLKFGRCCGEMSITDEVASRLIRLPLWSNMSFAEFEKVVNVVYQTVS